MVEPVDPFFHELQKEQNLQKVPMGFGKRLYNKVFHFYCWFLSRDINPEMHRELYKKLSIIMQIAKISFEGGYFLKEGEENTASHEFDDVTEELNSGMIKTQRLPEALQNIIKHLLINPKSKLVYELMHLEYFILIENPINLPSDAQEEFKLLINDAFKQITPRLSELQAQTVSRQIEKIRTSKEDNDLILKIKDILKVIYI